MTMGRSRISPVIEVKPNSHEVFTAELERSTALASAGPGMQLVMHAVGVSDRITEEGVVAREVFECHAPVVLIGHEASPKGGPVYKLGTCAAEGAKEYIGVKKDIGTHAFYVPEGTRPLVDVWDGTGEGDKVIGELAFFVPVRDR
jgi:hypothetical protein